MKPWIVAGLALLFSGCMTQYAKVPNPPAFRTSASVGSPVIGLAQVHDLRENEKAGFVGGMRMAVGADLREYLYLRFKQALADEGYFVLDAPNPQELKRENIKDVFDKKIVLGLLNEAHISTADSLMFPAEADIGFTVKVYDSSGAVLYDQTYRGEHSERIGLSGTGKKEGKILAQAADQLIDSIMADQSLLNAVKPAAAGEKAEVKPA